MKTERYKIYKKLCNVKGKAPVYIFILSGVSSLLFAAYPIIYKLYIDEVLVKEALKNLSYIVFLMLLWIGGIIWLKYRLRRQKNNFILGILREVKTELFDIYMHQNLNESSGRSASEMDQTINSDAEAIYQFFEKDIFVYFSNLVTFCILIVCMGVLNIYLFSLCFVFFLLSYFETMILKKSVVKNSSAYRDALVSENTYRTALINNYKEIKGLGVEKLISKIIDEKNQVLGSFVVKQRIYNYLNYYLGALNHDLIARFFIYVAGGLLVIKSDFPISSFLVFLGFYENFLKSVRAIIDSRYTFFERKVKLEKFIQLLEERRCKAAPYHPLSLQSISFDQVSFRYSKSSAWVLEQFSYDFIKGHIYQIVGRSGIGKSTLIKIILKELLAERGEVYLDDKALWELNEDQLYSLFSVASKESRIFNTSIEENLRMVNPYCMLQELRDACQKAELSDDIRKMPEGLKTCTGENGNRLSGGQRERLCMARLFLKNSPVIILDEALSEISVESEYRIISRLRASCRNSIIFVISHRELPLKDCEKVHL